MRTHELSLKNSVQYVDVDSGNLKKWASSVRDKKNYFRAAV